MSRDIVVKPAMVFKYLTKLFFQRGWGIVLIGVSILFWQEGISRLGAGKVLKGDEDSYACDLGGLRSASVLEDIQLPILNTFPVEMESLETKKKKQIFVCTLLPLILRVQEAIWEDRVWLLGLEEVEGTGEQERLDSLYEAYGLESSAGREALLKRVDIVPVSLVLAQAAVESGWGTSRFTKVGKAIFGQRVFHQKGMKPEGINEETSFTVRIFESLEESIVSYMFNLNSHHFYEEFRSLRAQQRASSQPVDSLSLSVGMKYYSERRMAYVQLLQSVIRGMSLRDFDGLVEAAFSP